MRVWPFIVLFTLGFFTISCGEEKDNRTVLNSQATEKQNRIVIPEGDVEGFVVDANNFSSAIAKRIQSISRVDKISMVDDYFFPPGDFTTSFRAITTDFKIYDGIKCKSYAHDILTDQYHLYLENCKTSDSNGARLGPARMKIPLVEIGPPGSVLH